MPARTGRHIARSITKQFPRALDRPARVLADVEAVQGDAGRVGRGAILDDER
jgi:hypothetical protein